MEFTREPQVDVIPFWVDTHETYFMLSFADVHAEIPRNQGPNGRHEKWINLPDNAS